MGDTIKKAEQEAEILLPDREITITHPDTNVAHLVTAREFRFLDGLRAQAMGKGLIEEIAVLASDEEAFTPSALNAVLGNHAEVWLDLCAMSSDLDKAIIARLRDPDATALSLAVWGANSDFFIGRILGQQIGQDALRNIWGSQMSSTASPPPGTAQPE